MKADGSYYILDNLMSGEQYVRAVRMHPFVIAPTAVLAGVSAPVMLIGFAAGAAGLGAFSLIVFLVTTPITLGLLVAQLTTEYSCTDRRIVIRSGLLTTQVREMPLAKVEALLIEQSVFGRIFGYGTLIFKGSGGTRRSCSYIDEPFEFYRVVQEQVATAQGRP